MFNFNRTYIGDESIRQFEEAFPVQVQSGNIITTLSGTSYGYSWTELGTEPSQGLLIQMDSPRTGQGNLFEVNNSNLLSGGQSGSAFIPFKAIAHYHGIVSGNASYYFHYGPVGANLVLSGTIVTSVACSGGTLAVTTANFTLQVVNGLITSGFFG